MIKDQHNKGTQILLAANSNRTITESLFSYESSTFPPSLTEKGKMHHEEKSEILDCLVPKKLENVRPVTTAAVLDGAVHIQMLRPRNAVTLCDYSMKELFP